MWITEHVYRFKSTKRSNAYLFKKDENEYCLVDTGMPGEGKSILQEIKSLKIQPEKISSILLTHSDIDHIGNTLFLKDELQASIIASEREMPYLNKQKEKKVRGFIGFLISFLKIFMKTPIIKADKYVKEGDTIHSLKVISSPGHTDGSISFYSTEFSLLFSGDALLSNDSGDVIGIVPGFTEASDRAIESLNELSELNFKTLLPGHGTPIKEGGSLLLKQYLEKE